MSRRWPLWFGLLLALAAVALGMAMGGNEIERWSAATRYTARVGFPLLILAYVARPLVDLTRSAWAKALLERRKWFGLGLALSHTVHLFAIIMLFSTLGEWPPAVTIIFGGFAYVLIYAMAFTSNPSAMKALGRRWKTLHRIGIHYVWLAFAQSYAGRIFEDGKMIEGAIGSSIAITAAMIRFLAWQSKRSRRQSRTAG